MRRSASSVAIYQASIIGELQPIAYIEKKYCCSSREVTHYGLTFMGRARNLSPGDVVKEEDIKGRFVRIQNAVEAERIAGVDLQAGD